MNCVKFQDSLSDYLEGALDPRGRAECAAHRLICGECRELYNDFRGAMQAMGELRQCDSEPEGLPDRIIAHMTITALAQFGRRKKPTAVVLLAHPSLTGINTGTGLSGSTGWGFSARAHIDMTHPDAKDHDGTVRPDTGIRRLTVMKTNNGRIGETINMIWDQGVYRCTDAAPKPDAGLGRLDRAERVFMKLLRAFERRGMPVSPKVKSRGTTFSRRASTSRGCRPPRILSTPRAATSGSCI